MSYHLGQIDPEERTGLYADPRDEEADPPPRRVLRIVGALLIMALFAGGLWFAYVEGARHMAGAGGSSDIPLIRADTRPMKVKPTEPGGMPIPDRDMLIYGQNRPMVEHLLPPPEQPMALPAPPVPKPVVSASPDAPTTPAPSTGAPGSGTPAAATQPEQSAGLPPTNPHPMPSKPAEEPGTAGGVRLQLGAVRSEGVAREEWARIKRSNPDLLGRLTAVAIRADLGDKGIYYRIQAGPVGDPATAERLCGELRQRHLPCIIVR